MGKGSALEQGSKNLFFNKKSNAVGFGVLLGFS